MKRSTAYQRCARAGRHGVALALGCLALAGVAALLDITWGWKVAAGVAAWFALNGTLELLAALRWRRLLAREGDGPIESRRAPEASTRR